MVVTLLALALYFLTGQVWIPQAHPLAAKPAAVQWCWYGSVQTYLRCPPGHGVKPAR